MFPESILISLSTLCSPPATSAPEGSPFESEGERDHAPQALRALGYIDHYADASAVHRADLRITTHLRRLSLSADCWSIGAICGKIRASGGAAPNRKMYSSPGPEQQHGHDGVAEPVSLPARRALVARRTYGVSVA